MCKVTTDTEVIKEAVREEVKTAVTNAIDMRVENLIEANVPAAVRGALLKSLGWIIGLFGLTIIIGVYSLGSWSTRTDSRITSLEVSEAAASADRKRDSETLNGLARDMDWVTGRATNRLIPKEGSNE